MHPHKLGSLLQLPKAFLPSATLRSNPDSAAHQLAILKYRTREQGAGTPFRCTHRIDHVDGLNASKAVVAETGCHTPSLQLRRLNRTRDRFDVYGGGKRVKVFQLPARGYGV